MNVITTDNLTKLYGERMGIASVNLAVPEGMVFGFLGPNGSGKTTTIRLLMALLRPTRGRAVIFGRDCLREAALIKAEVGYLPGDLRLYPWLTGREGLTICSMVRRRDVRSRGCELAEKFDLDMTVRVRRMSRGMRQKLGLILALAHEPRLLILDEPTASLDPIMQDRLKQHLRSLARRGHTIFFSSHTLSEVEDLCDRVGIVRNGRLVADETIEALKARAKREVTIRWRSDTKATELSAPAFLETVIKEDHLWKCTFGGDASSLIRWLAEQPVQDVDIGRPDLESLFRQYYQEGADD